MKRLEAEEMELEGQEKASKDCLSQWLSAWKYEYLVSLVSESGYTTICMCGVFATRCGTKLQTPSANWDPGLPHSQVNGYSHLSI